MAQYEYKIVSGIPKCRRFGESLEMEIIKLMGDDGARLPEQEDRGQIA